MKVSEAGSPAVASSGVEADLVAGGLVERLRRRERARLEVAAGDEEVGGQRLLLTVDREVGEGAVDAGHVEPDRHGPGPGRVHLRMQVAEPGAVAADDDQVHAPLVQLVELGDGLAVGVLDR